MTKGAYDVNDTYVGPTKDGSFKSCLCTMLIFVLICGILLIVAFTWGNYGRYGKPSPGNNLGFADQQTGSQNTNQENESVKSKEQSNPKPTKTPELTTTGRDTEINEHNEYTMEEEDNQIVPKEDNDNSKETVTDRPVGKKPVKSGKLLTSLTDNSTTTEPVPTKPAKVDNSEEKTNKSPESVTQAETPETTTISETAVLSNRLKPNYKTEQKIITNNENITSSTTTTESHYYENKDYTKSHDGEDRKTTKSYITNYKEGTTPPAITKQPKDDNTTVIHSVNEEKLKKLLNETLEDKVKDGNKTTTVEPENSTVISTVNEDNLKTLPKEKPRDTDKTIIITSPITTVEPEDDYTTVIPPVNEAKVKNLANEKFEDKDKTTITPAPITTVEPEDDYTTVISAVNKENVKNLANEKFEDKDKTTITPAPITTVEPEDDYTTVISAVNKENVKNLANEKFEDNDKTTITPSPTTTVEPEDDYTTVIPPVNEDNLKNLPNENSEDKYEDEGRSTTTVEPEDDYTTVIALVNEDKLKNLPNEKSEDKAEDEDETTTTINPPVNEDYSEDTLIYSTNNPEDYENEKTTMNPRSKKDNSEVEEEDEMSTVLPETTTIIYKSNLTKQSDITTQKPKNEITPRPTIMETEDVEQITRNTAAPNNHFNQNIVEDECNAECRKVGARILGRMNYSPGADPCEQFYDYACGGDNSDNVPEHNWKQIAGRLDRINGESPGSWKTFRRFYDSCVDFHSNYDYEKRVDEAKHILSSVGQPQQTKADDDGKLALTNLLTQLLQLDSSPLFDISVDVDKESKHFIFQLNIGKKFSTLQNEASELPSKRKCIAQSKKHFGFSLSHFDSINLDDMYTIYRNCQQNETYDKLTSNRALEAFDLHDDLETSLQHVENILEKIKGLPPPAGIRKDIITKNFVVRKVSELAFHYPLIEWKQILTNLTGKEVHEEDLVQVYFKDFFFTLFSGKQTLSRLEIHNAILTMFIHDLYTSFVLPRTMANPEEFCLHQSTDMMKEVASSLYLKSINQNDIKGDQKRIEDLFAKMKQKLKEILQSVEWAEGVRFSLIKKLNKIDLDSWDRSLLWENVTILEERMRSVNNIAGDYSDFLPALMRRNRQMLYNMWDTMGYEKQNVWWHFLTPYSTKPVSIYALNKIVIPPAMLFTMSEDIPRYLSLAKLGYSLAKAIGYHFDYTGSKYDVYLDQKSKLAYDDSKACSLTRFHHAFQMEHDGKNVQFMVNNDSLMLSLNERFVEDMAINLVSAMSNEDVTDYQISWISSNPDLAEHFTREKIFIIALAQENCRKPELGDFLLHLFESEHLPPSLLLDTAMSHSELFNDVFNCKQGARLNAVYKCQAFPEFPEVEDYYSDNN